MSKFITRGSRRAPAFGSAGAGQAAEAAVTALNDPAGVLRALVRMRTAADGGPGLWWFRGSFFAKPEGELTQLLLTVQGVSHVRYTAAGDDRFHFQMEEAGFFLDPVGDAIVDRWLNPLNGRQVQPRHFRSSAKAIVDPLGLHADSGLPAGIIFSGTLSPATVQGDTLWISEDIFAKARLTQADEPASYQILTSLATFQSRLNDLARPGWVPATLAYSTLGSWLPWMEMGDRPGVISWRLVGRKLPLAAELPGGLRAALASRQSEFLDLLDEISA